MPRRTGYRSNTAKDCVFVRLDTKLWRYQTADDLMTNFKGVCKQRHGVILKKGEMRYCENEKAYYQRVNISHTKGDARKVKNAQSAINEWIDSYEDDDDEEEFDWANFAQQQIWQEFWSWSDRQRQRFEQELKGSLRRLAGMNRNQVMNRFPGMNHLPRRNRLAGRNHLEQLKDLVGMSHYAAVNRSIVEAAFQEWLDDQQTQAQRRFEQRVKWPNKMSECAILYLEDNVGLRFDQWTKSDEEHWRQQFREWRERHLGNF